MCVLVRIFGNDRYDHIIRTPSSEIQLVAIDEAEESPNSPVLGQIPGFGQEAERQFACFLYWLNDSFLKILYS